MAAGTQIEHGPSETNRRACMAFSLLVAVSMVVVASA